MQISLPTLVASVLFATSQQATSSENTGDTVTSTDGPPPPSLKTPIWRRPMGYLFPDKKLDGQLQHPETQGIIPFDHILKQEDPFSYIQQHLVYYPKDDPDPTAWTLFIPGLGQTSDEASVRSLRYAERLHTGIANFHNGSFLKDRPLWKRVNGLLDWMDATVHRLGFSHSPVIDHAAKLMNLAIQQQHPLSLSADSHGTILLGRALIQAKEDYFKRHKAKNKLKVQKRKRVERQWREESQEYIQIFAFGNGYRNWVEGPKYIMCYIQGDPLVEKVGLSMGRYRKTHRKRSTTRSNNNNNSPMQFLRFESLFAKGDFEAHNMMYTIELLRQSFIQNQWAIGDFLQLYQGLQQKDDDQSTTTMQLVNAQQAKDASFPWPKDMKQYTWGPEGSAKEILNLIEE